MMKPISDVKRVEETAAFIAAELRKLLVDGSDAESHMSRHLRKCSTYNNGLTRGEELLATVRALSMVQLEILTGLGSMWMEQREDEDEDDAGPSLHQIMTDSELLRRLSK
jgi:hypothetical protein